MLSSTFICNHFSKTFYCNRNSGFFEIGFLNKREEELYFEVSLPTPSVDLSDHLMQGAMKMTVVNYLGQLSVKRRRQPPCFEKEME